MNNSMVCRSKEDNYILKQISCVPVFITIQGYYAQVLSQEGSLCKIIVSFQSIDDLMQANGNPNVSFKTYLSHCICVQGKFLLSQRLRLRHSKYILFWKSSPNCTAVGTHYSVNKEHKICNDVGTRTLNLT